MIIYTVKKGDTLSSIARANMTTASRIIADNGIEIKYMYACISRHEGKALMIVSVEDVDAAEALIAGTSAGNVHPGDIYRL